MEEGERDVREDPPLRKVEVRVAGWHVAIQATAEAAILVRSAEGVPDRLTKALAHLLAAEVETRLGDDLAGSPAICLSWWVGYARLELAGLLDIDRPRVREVLAESVGSMSGAARELVHAWARRAGVI